MMSYINEKLGATSNTQKFGELEVVDGTTEAALYYLYIHSMLVGSLDEWLMA